MDICGVGTVTLVRNWCQWRSQSINQSKSGTNHVSAVLWVEWLVHPFSWWRRLGGIVNVCIFIFLLELGNLIWLTTTNMYVVYSLYTQKLLIYEIGA